MIRPRQGDFLYTEAEFEMMQRDIALMKSAGAQGVVFGILLADGHIDSETNARTPAIGASPCVLRFIAPSICAGIHAPHWRS